MTIENDFLPFAVGGGANVIDQAAYAADSSLLSNGFQSGIAQSNQLNKVWRQSSIVATVIAELIVANSGQPAIDDGTTATLLANLETAITNIAASVSSSVGFNPSGTYHSVASSQNGMPRTNSTGYMMQVTICAGDGSGQSLVGSIVVAGVTIASNLNGSVFGHGDMESFLVAPGASYSFTFNALANLIAWHEFY